MNYIVFDLEWNQPFGRWQRINSPVRLMGEIIQIGAVKLDENFQEIDTFNITVRPKFYTKIEWSVYELTGMTDEDLRHGIPFPMAIKYFKRWCGEDFVFLMWGSEDDGMLRDNLLLHKLSSKWLPDFYNLQALFDGQITHERRQISLTDAMEIVQEEVFTAHDALNDAKATARICCHLDMEAGLSEYDRLNRQMNINNSEQEVKIVGEKYTDRIKVMEDQELLNFYSEMMNTTISCNGVLRQNSEKFIAIGQMGNGDTCFVRFKITKGCEGIYYVKRIVRELTEENLAYYNLIKQKRLEKHCVETFA